MGADQDPEAITSLYARSVSRKKKSPNTPPQKSAGRAPRFRAAGNFPARSEEPPLPRSDPGADGLLGCSVVAQEEDHFLQRSRAEWEDDGAWTLRLHVLCGGRRDWARAARAGGAWTAPWLGPPPDEAMTRALLGGFEAAAKPGPEVATPPGSPRPKGKGGGPPPASPATPHTAAMTAPLAPSVRTHDYPSDFLEKWAEAAGCRAVQGSKRERNSRLQRLLSRPVSTRYG